MNMTYLDTIMRIQVNTFFDQRKYHLHALSIVVGLLLFVQKMRNSEYLLQYADFILNSFFCVLQKVERLL